MVMKQSEFLAALDQDAIRAAIVRAEGRSSGEVRVHVQPRTFRRPVQEVAERTFERLGMTRTALRNGVLLFIASEEHLFAIIGDRGIDEKVPDGFWDDVASALTERFKSGELSIGIIEAIEAVGEHLARHFPRSGDDVDELSNDLSISDETDP
jgi:uncharacterized membrane protein